MKFLLILIVIIGCWLWISRQRAALRAQRLQDMQDAKRRQAEFEALNPHVFARDDTRGDKDKGGEV